MKQDFVCFESPGTVVSEGEDKKISSWDVDKAVSIAVDIHARYGARPYGFRFKTKEFREKEFRIVEIAKSCFYFLGGTVVTQEQVEAAVNEDGSLILTSNPVINHLAQHKQRLSNIRWNLTHNSYDRIVINNNSYVSCLPAYPEDIVLDPKDFAKAA